MADGTANVAAPGQGAASATGAHSSSFVTWSGVYLGLTELQRSEIPQARVVRGPEVRAELTRLLTRSSGSITIGIGGEIPHAYRDDAVGSALLDAARRAHAAGRMTSVKLDQRLEFRQLRKELPWFSEFEFAGGVRIVRSKPPVQDIMILPPGTIVMHCKGDNAIEVTETEQFVMNLLLVRFNGAPLRI